MAADYYFHYDEHHRWLARTLGSGAAATLPHEDHQPSPEEIATLLWPWLVSVHGPGIESPLLLELSPVQRVMLVLVDVQLRTQAEAARTLLVPLPELRATHDRLHARLRLPEAIRPMCLHWGEVRGAHRLLDDEDALAAVRRHFGRCACCQRGARGVAAVRRWWTSRLEPLEGLDRGGVHRALPAFAGTQRRALRVGALRS